MNKMIRVAKVLVFSFLLSHSSILPSDNISIDKNKALRIIGIATAIGGVIIVSHKNGSTFLGLVFLTTGTATAIYSEEIIKKLPKFFKKTSKVANNIYHKLQQYCYNEQKPEQEPST